MVEIWDTKKSVYLIVVMEMTRNIRVNDLKFYEQSLIKLSLVIDVFRYEGFQKGLILKCKVNDNKNKEI